MIMQIIGFLMKMIGFFADQKGASDQVKKDIIDLSKKMSDEGLLPTRVNDKMKEKWAKIDAQIKKDNEERNNNGNDSNTDQSTT